MDSELFNLVPMYGSYVKVLNKIHPLQRILETDAVKAIQNILNSLCELHELPLAHIWIKHCDFDDLYIRESACYTNDSSMQDFVMACKRNPLKKGQNVAGKAVNLMHQYTVADVSLLDLADYPFVDHATKLGLRAAMAVRLKCMSVREIEYVAEIFLPTNLKDSVEQNNLINDILSSLRTKCENSGTVELQIQADPKLNMSEEVEASQIPTVAVSKSSFPHVGLNLEEKIQNNRVETDEPHEEATVTECELFESEKEFSAKSRNGTTSLHRQGCFKDWKKDGKQQSVSNVESSAKANPKNEAYTDEASPKIGAGAPPQAKRRKLVAKVGEERSEEEETSSASTNATVMAEGQYPIVSGIVQAAVSGLAHDQVQELTVQDDYTAKETRGRGLKDQERHIGSEDGDLDSSTTSSIATTSGFPVISAASELRSFLSQSPQVLLSPTENDRLCSLLNAEINAASNEWEKHPARELLAEVHRLKEAIASCPSSSRPETVSLLNYENLALAISQSAILRSNLEAEITSLTDQAAQLEEQLKAINEQRTQKELELSTVKENEAGMQIRALQSCLATAQKLKIDNIVAGMPGLFDFVKSVLPKP